MIVVIVESSLAPGDDAPMLCQPVEMLEVNFAGQPGVVGVDVHAGVDPVVLLGEWQGRIEFGRPGAAADGEDRTHAGLLRAVEHLGTVSSELGEVEVRMRVDEFHGTKLSQFNPQESQMHFAARSEELRIECAAVPLIPQGRASAAPLKPRSAGRLAEREGAPPHPLFFASVHSKGL